MEVVIIYKKFSHFEEITIKRMKSYGFRVIEKLDDKYKDIKSPDFLFTNDKGYKFISEIKYITKFPRKESVLKYNGKIISYGLDSQTVVEQILEEVNGKWKGLLSKDTKYSKIPYIFVVFNAEWLWDRFGFRNDDIYRNFLNISAIFREVKNDPRKDEWINLSLDDHEKYIIQDNGRSRFREVSKMQVIINKYADNKVKMNNFLNTELIRL